MIQSNRGGIKREKKKALFFREVSVLIQKIAETEPSVADVLLSRVDFSDDFGILYLFFTSVKEPAEGFYKAALEVLKLYKPSIRKSLAQTLQGRYTPEIVFMYDNKFEKIRRVNELLDKVHEELEQSGDN